MNIKKQLGQRIAKLRKAKGYSQEKFAELIGIATSSLSYIETGTNFLQPRTLEKIIEVLDVEPQELFRFSTVEKSAELYKKLVKRIATIKDDENKLHTLYEFVQYLI